jgi:transcriptional regulator of acetoin/glycerol metabolism
MERAVLLCDGMEVLPTQLPAEISRQDREGIPAVDPNLKGQERDIILKALQENRWNQSKTARVLGLTRDNLRYRIKKYNLDAPP